MSEKTSEVKPYIPAEQTVAEATVRAILLGSVLAIVMAAANTYLGLKVGMTVSASIPAAVISMALLRALFRSGTILENNVVQTMASTGESLAAGAIFTIPALVLVGQWQDFQFWPTTLIVMLGGMLGVIFMVPMRRALIVGRPDLIYPEGVACSEVLIVGQEGGSGVKTIAAGLGIGALFKFLATGLHLVKDSLEGAFAIGDRVFYGGVNMSAALVAVGYIVNLQIASLVFLGGCIAWVIAIPVMGGYDNSAGPLETAWDLWDRQIRYMGVGAMLIGGLYSIWNVRKGVVAGVLGLRGVEQAGGSAEAPRTDRDLSLSFLLTVFAFTALGTLAFYYWLVQSAFIAAVAAVVMILAAFLFVAVATYIVGLVGSSNSPVSGMTICALLMTATVLLILGVESDSAILATLGVAGVVCCAACTSGDIAQDLKTGQLVGATPRNLQWTEMVGVLVPAFFFAPIMSMLHHAYEIGSRELLAPQAQLFASLVQGFFGDGDLPKDMILYGVIIGAVLIAVNTVLERKGSKIRTHVMPVAVGIYLPLSLSAPIFIGGLLRLFVERMRAGKGGMFDNGVLFGSGLIAGEALMGIGLAIPIALQDRLGFSMPGGEGFASVSIIAFAIVLGSFVYFARRPSLTP